MNVQEYYQQALSERGFAADEAQRLAVERLQRYFDNWIEFKRQRCTTLKQFFMHPEVPRGIYMLGGVGRGKSFLMDAFYLTVPVKRKTRLHLPEFMRGLHRELREVRGHDRKSARQNSRRY